MRTGAAGLRVAVAASLLGAAVAALAPRAAAGQERGTVVAGDATGLVATRTSAWETDEQGRVFRVGFDPGSRWLLGGGWALGTAAEGWAGFAGGQVETGVLLRHTFEDLEEQTVWKLDHALLAGRVWLGDVGRVPVPRVDATLFRGAYLRWQRDGFVTLPTSPPRRLHFPLNLGLDVVAGRFETAAPESGLAARLELLRSHFLLDAWRSPTPGVYARFGLGLGYDLWLTGSFGEGGVDGVEHLVSPGSDFTAAVGWESDDGRHAVQAGGSCGAWWSDRRGWGARAQAAASYELVWLALDDQPLSAYVEAAYRYEQLLPAGAHELLVTLGLRLGIPLSGREPPPP